MPELNEAQRQAVTASDGPALVLAGAGTGKTRVIVERLVWLVEERGIDPRHLLALTFTNRAAGEMKNRVAERLGVDGSAMWVGTFHAFGLYVLRRDLDKLGRSTSFVIYDEADQLSTMKRLIKALPAGSQAVSPREALSWTSRLKQEFAEPEWETPCQTPEEKVRRDLWKQYHEVLERHSAVDFDDLLVLPAKLFEQHKDVLEKYQRRYRHVLVDEYQDTNRVQYLLARSLCGSDGSLFVVGDEDQSIYSWRGADIRNILMFENDFPNAKVFRLEQNYRSVQPILDVANAVVCNNVQRLGKTLRAARTGGEPVRYHCAGDGDAEAGFVVQDMVNRGLSPSEVAVLFRVNTQSRLFEECLRCRGIACVVVGGVRFYGRKEVKDILAYLRALVNPKDDEAVQRILNVPLRGLGAATMARFAEYAAARALPLVQVLREVEQDQTFSARIRDEVKKFVCLVDDLALEAGKAPVVSVVKALIERTGYREYLRASDEKDYRARLETVDEFINGCAQFDKDRRPGELAAFLQEISLLTDVDEWTDNTPAVTLMTCHSAKGLEFPHVFLVGLEEGLLPHATAVDSDEEMEEERRLCYVAMTRARETLTLTSAETRLVYGASERRNPSRFLGEIPGKLLSLVQGETGGKPMPAARPPVAAGALKTGTRIRHGKFGEGVVMYTAGSGSNLKAYIRFQTGRTRAFMVDKTPLEILEGRKR